MTEPVLAEYERQSAVWLKVRAHYEKRLAGLREKNDGNLSPEATTRLRGQIYEIKELLALGVTKMPEPMQDIPE